MGLLLRSTGLVVWCLGTAGAAQEEAPALFAEACAADRARLCPGDSGPRDAARCLAAHREQLSEGCKEALQQAAQANRQSAARGGGALGSFGGAGFLSPPVPVVSYEGRDLSGADGLAEHRANLSLPLHKSSTGTLSLSLAAGRLRWDESPLLDNGAALPRTLSRAEAGLQYFHRLPRQRAWGLRGSLGYAGDELFQDSRDLAFSLNAFYAYPAAGKNTWALTLYLANNGPLAAYVPVPGFIYFHRTEKFSGMFGLPFASVQWTPAPAWSLGAALFGPTFSSEICRGEAGGGQAFAGFAWTLQRYMLSGRANPGDRLSLEEKKALVGLRGPLFGTFSGEIQLGRVFDRRAFVGDGLFDRDGGAAELSDATQIGASLRASF